MYTYSHKTNCPDTDSASLFLGTVSPNNIIFKV